MGRKARNRIGAALGAAMAGAVMMAAAPASAASLLDNFWLPNDSYSGNVPACSEPLALGTISMRFAETERM
ncbi:MAG: hypothetical protein B7Y71_00640, partial [Xanthobacter sp. 35-67-6]